MTSAPGRTPLAVYLRNHEAAAQGGLDLFRRAASSHRRHAYAPDLRELRDEVRADLDALRRIMRALGVHPNPLLAAAVRGGERVGRLKPNGRLLRRSSLTDLVELEGLALAVRAKSRGWHALLRADLGLGPAEPDLALLVTRAESQASRLDQLHEDTAARVLTARSL